MFLYQTKSTHVLMRPGFSEQDIWRKALGDNAPLLVFADRLPTLDAPEHLAAGYSGKHDFTRRA